MEPWSRNLRNFRCAKEDNAGKKSLIVFLVRNNVLPKYGFPVDTVELIPDINSVGRGKSLQLARDLQMAKCISADTYEKCPAKIRQLHGNKVSIVPPALRVFRRISRRTLSRVRAANVYPATRLLNG